MLKIYGRRTSINVMRVLWTLAELDLPYQHDQELGGAYGRNKDADYLALNPNGLVPTIDDDGFILWESNSIIRYLAAKQGSPLYPADMRARADVERWMDWCLSTLARPMTPLFWGLIRTPPDRRDHAAIEQAREQANVVFSILEAHLKERAYLGGTAMSIGDLSVGPFVYRWLALPVERPRMPNIERYRDRLALRPGFRAHVMRPLE